MRETLILTAHTQFLNNIAEHTLPLLKKYADSNNYDFKCETAGWDMSRPFPWTKICFLQNWLRFYNVVVWMDIDIVITNPTIKIEEIVSRHPLGEVYICEEFIPKGEMSKVDRKNVNTGVMILKKSTFTFNLLNHIWALKQPVKDYEWCDQSRLIEIQKNGEIDLSQLILCEQKEFNSMYINNSWSPGDFLIHFAGYDVTYKKDKTEEIKKFVQIANNY